MNFNELLVNTVDAFIGSGLGAEEIEYLKSGAAPAGQSAETMATSGVLSGNKAVMAADGVILPDVESHTSRTIWANIDREVPNTPGDALRGQAPLCIVSMANDSVKGISSREIDTGKDLIKLAVRLGQAIQARRIGRILSHDAGMLRLEVW